MDLQKRNQVIQKVFAIYAQDKTLPVVSLKEFFDGNDDDLLIAVNLNSHPGIAAFAEILQMVKARMMYKMCLWKSIGALTLTIPKMTTSGSPAWLSSSSHQPLLMKFELGYNLCDQIWLMKVGMLPMEYLRL